MAENSRIQWTHHTFNPWRGCSKVSAGCANCYAETTSNRNHGIFGSWGPNGTRVVAAESMWREPLKWDRAAKAAGERHRVFCASMSDVFEDWGGWMLDAKGQPCVTCDSCKNPTEHGCGERTRLLTMNDVRSRLFAMIDATPNLDWLLLTKRPENIARMMPEPICPLCKGKGGWETGPHSGYCLCRVRKVIRHNVWIGTSAENQEMFDKRVPHLLKVPAVVRFLSCEPLLGPIAMEKITLRANGQNPNELSNDLGDWVSPLTGVFSDSPLINWVIAGGESGNKARDCNIEWVRSIVKQCKAAGTSVFVKQLGERLNVANDSGMEWPHYGDEWETIPENYMPRFQGERVSLRMADKGGNIEEWPEDLRIRQFPVVKK